MRINGTYDTWEKEKLLKNRKAWIDDMIKSIYEWKDLKSPEWYNNVGLDTPEVEKEKWEIDTTQIQLMADEALEEYNKVLTELENV